MDVRCWNSAILAGFCRVPNKGDLSSDLSATALQLENAIRDNIIPVPYYELIRKEVDGKRILEVKVFHGENQPYLLKGTAYVRRDTASVPVDREMLKRLVMKGRKLGFDTLMVSDTREREFAVLKAKLEKAVGVERLDENVLKSLGLIQADAYTNAAVLLSDKPQIQSATIELVRFAGANVVQISDHKTLANMSVLEQYDQAMEFFEKHQLVQERIESAYRKTLEEVPLLLIGKLWQI